jgi:dihydrofolate synthase/folylpolyglutamate synthase
VAEGLVKAEWKGRLTRLNAAMLPEGSELWFDGGHNMAAGQVIGLYASEHWQDRPLYMIFGTSKSKDIVPILAPFAEIVQRVYAVAIKSEPLSYSADAIVSIAQPLLPTEPAEGIAEVLRDIAAREPRPCRVLIFGSLYLWLEASLLQGQGFTEI